MSTNTGIEWTDSTWSPVVGCTKVSPGCKNCYAKTLHDKRHKAYLAGKMRNVPQYAEPFETVQMLAQRITDPIHWRKPRRVFVNSQSDVFHRDITDAFRDRMFVTMAWTQRHSYQILTKRAEEMREYSSGLAALDPEARAHRMIRSMYDGHPAAYLTHGHVRTSGFPWPLPNVWLGVSVEDQRRLDERIPLLVQTPAAVRFLSCEPLLGPLDFSTIGGLAPLPAGLTFPVAGIDWVIVGGESGPKFRAMELDWARSIREQCAKDNVAFFFKQVGGRTPKAGGRLLDGVEHSAFPASLVPDAFSSPLSSTEAL